MSDIDEDYIAAYQYNLETVNKIEFNTSKILKRIKNINNKLPESASLKKRYKALPKKLRK